MDKTILYSRYSVMSVCSTIWQIILPYSVHVLTVERTTKCTLIRASGWADLEVRKEVATSWPEYSLQEHRRSNYAAQRSRPISATGLIGDSFKHSPVTYLFLRFSDDGQSNLATNLPNTFQSRVYEFSSCLLVVQRR